MTRYSDDDAIDQAVIGLVACMNPDPYPCAGQPSPVVKRGTMSIADVIERIRFQYGDRAARSVKIVVH
jgi:hypothetical protein